MANQITYRFYLSIDGGAAVAVTPTWKGDTNRTFEMDGVGNGGQFHRTKITSEFKFFNNDFDLIFAASLESEFELLMEENIAGTWQTFFLGYFTKIDCEFDEDNSRVNVTPKRKDAYDDVLGGMDKEYNFLDLDTKGQEIGYKKHPALQIYFPLTNFLTTFIGSTYYETPVPSPADSLALSDPGTGMGFGSAGDPEDTLNFVTGTDNDLSPDVSGFYEVVPAVPSGNKFQSVSGQYAFTRLDLGGGNFRDVIIDQDNSDTVVYQAEINETAFSFNEDRFTFQGLAELTSVTDSNSKCQFVRAQTHVRLLTDKDEVLGTPTQEYDPVVDIGESNFNYEYVLPVEDLHTFAISDNRNESEGKWGKFPDDVSNFPNQYYGDYILPNEATYPLARSEWRAASFWHYYTNELRALQSDAGFDLTLRHGYRLSSIISALLAEIAPDITHEPTEDYSVFLYSKINPVSLQGQPELFVTPATNLTVGDYDQPAQRANIRLGDICTMLWMVYRLGWVIEDNKLKFEHISYFDNGGSYSAPVVGENLDELLEPKTGKAWSYRTNKYKYETSEMPERIVLKWASENASTPFYGFPIEVRSAYAQKGNIQENVVPRFYTDLDYLLSNPSRLNDEDLILLGVVESGPSKVVPFLTFTTGNDRTYTMQNGYLSAVYLHHYYHRHSMPAENVTINEEETTATTVVRTKIREIKYPLPNDFDPQKLIQTGGENGRLKSATQNLSNRTAELTILYDTE